MGAARVEWWTIRGLWPFGVRWHPNRPRQRAGGAPRRHPGPQPLSTHGVGFPPNRRLYPHAKVALSALWVRASSARGASAPTRRGQMFLTRALGHSRPVSGQVAAPASRDSVLSLGLEASPRSPDPALNATRGRPGETSGPQTGRPWPNVHPGTSWATDRAIAEPSPVAIVLTFDAVHAPRGPRKASWPGQFSVGARLAANRRKGARCKPGEHDSTFSAPGPGSRGLDERGSCPESRPNRVRRARHVQVGLVEVAARCPEWNLAIFQAPGRAPAPCRRRRRTRKPPRPANVVRPRPDRQSL